MSNEIELKAKLWDQHESVISMEQNLMDLRTKFTEINSLLELETENGLLNYDLIKKEIIELVQYEKDSEMKIGKLEKELSTSKKTMSTLRGKIKSLENNLAEYEEDKA